MIGVTEQMTDGVLLFDKPEGWSSHRVVSHVKRSLGGKSAPRVGHAGTLDPFATGLLIVLVGRATRIQRHLMAQDKSYWTRARLGALSSTGDIEGEITITGRIPDDPPALPTGLVKQVPPAFSAVKIDGVRAYRLARKGLEVEMPERTVTVKKFVQTARDGDIAEFEIDCSSGTYIRSLITDLEDGYCLELRRTAIGDFSVDDAVSPDVPVQEWQMHGIAETLQPLLTNLHLDEQQARRVGFGQRLDAAKEFGDRVDLSSREQLALYFGDEIVGIGEVLDDGCLHPVVGFRS